MTTEDDELTENLRTRFAQIEAPPGDYTQVQSKYRGRRMRRLALGGVMAAVLLAGFVVPIAKLFSLGESSKRTVTQPTNPAQVALIECDASAIHVLTSTVQTQPDGVHFEISGTSVPAYVEVPKGITIGDALAGKTEVVWRLPPQEQLLLQCVTRDQGVAGDPETLSIIDPAELWVPTEVDCRGLGMSEGSVDYVPTSGSGLQGDVVKLTRDYLGDFIKAGDVVELAGYPKGVPAIVRVVRLDRIVGTVTFSSDGQGGWVPQGEKLCWS